MITESVDAALGRIFGPVLLNEVDDHRQDDDRCDDQEARVLVGERGNAGGEKKDQHERVGKTLGEANDQQSVWRLLKLIGPIFREAIGGLFGVQAAGGSRQSRVFIV